MQQQLLALLVQLFNANANKSAFDHQYLLISEDVAEDKAHRANYSDYYLKFILWS